VAGELAARPVVTQDLDVLRTLNKKGLRGVAHLCG